MEVRTVKIMSRLAAILLAFMLGWPTVSSYASCDVAVTFTQGDCDLVDHWELSADEQSVGTLDTFCAPLMSGAIFVQGVGVKAFRLRAVTATGYMSAWSDPVSCELPLARPVVTSTECE
jgi:hypothetical protein